MMEYIWIAESVLYVVNIYPITQFLEISIHKGRGYS